MKLLIFTLQLWSKYLTEKYKNDKNKKKNTNMRYNNKCHWKPFMLRKLKINDKNRKRVIMTVLNRQQWGNNNS